ncbi:hypothetical protein ALC62_16001 [Cyphomyrmex costatus]|uniref:Uncharacterized protein n=1 Tax=Cyphomyrmex costatus TaxID=456900 RepID=A0A151I6F9_9HYME|nr:hypothetical protein ALC62_16001 [Cyphomyrmex costatus]
MDETNSIAERKRTAKLIAKTRASIRKKHRALKTGIMESENALEKRFKPIVEPLRQIVDITVKQPNFRANQLVANFASREKGKRKHSDNDNDDNDVNDDAIARKSKQNRSPLKEQSSNVMSQSINSQLHFPAVQDEDVFETSNNADPSLETSVREVLRTPQGRDRLISQLGPLGHIYINALLSGDKRNEIDNVYGLGVPTTMRVTDNKVDYVHWDDPNELVDRLQLLDASRSAGNNAHDNEILSIIDELRESGFIIN